MNTKIITSLALTVTKVVFRRFYLFLPLIAVPVLFFALVGVGNVRVFSNASLYRITLSNNLNKSLYYTTRQGYRVLLCDGYGTTDITTTSSLTTTGLLTLVTYQYHLFFDFLVFNKIAVFTWHTAHTQQNVANESWHIDDLTHIRYGQSIC